MTTDLIDQIYEYAKDRHLRIDDEEASRFMSDEGIRVQVSYYIMPPHSSDMQPRSSGSDKPFMLRDKQWIEIEEQYRKERSEEIRDRLRKEEERASDNDGEREKSKKICRNLARILKLIEYEDGTLSGDYIRSRTILADMITRNRNMMTAMEHNVRRYLSMNPAIPLTFALMLKDFEIQCDYDLRSSFFTRTRIPVPAELAEALRAGNDPFAYPADSEGKLDNFALKSGTVMFPTAMPSTFESLSFSGSEHGTMFDKEMSALIRTFRDAYINGLYKKAFDSYFRFESILSDVRRRLHKDRTKMKSTRQLYELALGIRRIQDDAEVDGILDALPLSASINSDTDRAYYGLRLEKLSGQIRSMHPFHDAACVAAGIDDEIMANEENASVIAEELSNPGREDELAKVVCITPLLLQDAAAARKGIRKAGISEISDFSTNFALEPGKMTRVSTRKELARSLSFMSDSAMRGGYGATVSAMIQIYKGRTKDMLDYIHGYVDAFCSLGKRDKENFLIMLAYLRTDEKISPLFKERYSYMSVLKGERPFLLPEYGKTMFKSVEESISDASPSLLSRATILREKIIRMEYADALGLWMKYKEY